MNSAWETKDVKVLAIYLFKNINIFIYAENVNLIFKWSLDQIWKFIHFEK